MSITFTHQNNEFKVGDSVKVNYKIREKDKERIQAFDGVILSITGTEDNKNFVVQRHSADSITVERIFPSNSPLIESIKKLRSPKTKIRRSKLYYLRNPKAKTI